MDKIVIGAVTPTLMDRPRFLEKCEYMMDRQSVLPDIHLFVNHPGNGTKDISKRYKYGIQELIKKKCDLIFLIEDDDYYPPTYIEEMVNKWLQAGRPKVIGCKTTIYYHLKTKQYAVMRPEFCSAFCTAVTPGIITDVCDDDYPFYDYALWNKNKGVQVELDWLPIGIKHGEGMCGGRGHLESLNWYKYYVDENKLKEWFDTGMLDFYNNYFKS